MKDVLYNQSMLTSEYMLIRIGYTIKSVRQRNEIIFFLL